MGGLSFMLIKEEEKKQEVAMVQEVEEQEEQIRKEPENVMNLISRSEERRVGKEC